MPRWDGYDDYEYFVGPGLKVRGMLRCAARPAVTLETDARQTPTTAGTDLYVKPLFKMKSATCRA